MIWFIPLCVLIIGFFIYKFYSSESSSSLSEINEQYLEKSKEVAAEIKRLAEENEEQGVDIRLVFSHNPSIDEHCIVFDKAGKIMLNGYAYKFQDIGSYKVTAGKDVGSQRPYINTSGLNAAFGGSFKETAGDAVKELVGKKGTAFQMSSSSSSEKSDIVDVYVKDDINPVRLYVYPPQVQILCDTLDAIIAKNHLVKTFPHYGDKKV
jgi:hypothetical protein